MRGQQDQFNPTLWEKMLRPQDVDSEDVWWFLLSLDRDEACQEMAQSQVSPSPSQPRDRAPTTIALSIKAGA